MALAAPRSRGWIAQSTRSIAALVFREMATSYGRSPGGYIWAVLEPAAGIALLTFVFSIMFHAPPLGNNFAIFYATGLLPYLFYVQMNTRLMVAIWYSKPLLQYPAVSFIDALFSRALLGIITQTLVFASVISTILLIFEPRVTLNPGRIALALSMVIVLGGGIGVLNCLLISAFPVWQRIWNILHKPMFLISGIFYVLEAIPEPYRSILWYNPLVHITGVMRSGFYPTYGASFAAPAYVFGFGLSCLVIGLFFLRRWHRDFLYQ